MYFLGNDDISLSELLLFGLIAGSNSRRSIYEFCGEYRLRSIDESEWRLICGAVGGSTDSPENCWEFFYPPLATLFKPVKGAGPETAQHFCIGSLCLAVASRMSY